MTVSVHQIEAVKLQLKTAFERDLQAVDRVKRLLEESYKDQLRQLDRLLETAKLSVEEGVEYVAPESLEEELEPSWEANVPVGLGSAINSVEILPSLGIPEDKSESIRTVRDIKGSKNDEETEEDGSFLFKVAGGAKTQHLEGQSLHLSKIESLALFFAAPFTLSYLMKALRQMGSNLSVEEVKRVLVLLNKEKFLVRYEVRGAKGLIVFYQHAQIETPIKEAVTRLLKARQINEAARRQEQAIHQSRADLPLLDSAPVRRTAAQTKEMLRKGPNPTPVEGSEKEQPQRRSRKDRR